MKHHNANIFRGTLIIAISSAIVFFSCNSKSSSADKNTSEEVKKETSAKIEKNKENVLILNENNFDETISSDITLVDFWATWCKPCRLQAPIIDELQKEMISKIKVGKLDIDQNQEIADKYGIQSIPTMIIFKDGKPAEQFVGITSKEKLTEAINKLLK